MPEIELAYDHQRWRAFFQAEAERLAALLRIPVESCRHVGSTAVPGLAAKPTVDLLLPLPVSATYADYWPRLATLDYVECEGLWRERLQDRFVFIKMQGARRLAHLHLVREEQPALHRMGLFVRYLRDHPAAVQEYETLKRRLAGLHPDDRVAYNDGKSGFIQHVTDLAEAAWPERHGVSASAGRLA